MKRLVLTVMLTALTAAAPALALKGSADVVTAAPAAAAVHAAAGQRVTFAVAVDIKDTWHLYAHADTNFIGVDLVPAEDFPLADFQADYPAGHEGEFFGEKVFMISGQETIRASALVPADLPVGVVELELALTVQACDDKTCLAPAYLPVKLKLTVD